MHVNDGVADGCHGSIRSSARLVLQQWDVAIFRRNPKPADVPDELPSPGWQAIDDAMAHLYGDQQPRHVGYYPPMALSDNLQGCSAYDAGSHWHFVSYGMSELYVPGPEADPSISGWGYEFTFRLTKNGESEPPDWPFTLINALANDANRRGVLYTAGDRIDIGKAITGYPNVEDVPPTRLTVLALTQDTELPERQTPNGRLGFLQLVGVTADQKAHMLARTTAEVLAELQSGNPLLVTTP
jgi:hypothetical protein